MSQTWQTVLLSLATSLIVSLVTFILGLKSGKNQTDRAKLQNMYRDLYSHFLILKTVSTATSREHGKAIKRSNRDFTVQSTFPLLKSLKEQAIFFFLRKKLPMKP